jgi:hypothetical protein
MTRMIRDRLGYREDGFEVRRVLLVLKVGITYCRLDRLRPLGWFRYQRTKETWGVRMTSELSLWRITHFPVVGLRCPLETAVRYSA